MVSARVIALFLLGMVAFNPPLLAIFDVDTFVLGVPLLYVYLFAAWGVLIALVRLAAERSSGADAEDLDEHGGY